MTLQLDWARIDTVMLDMDGTLLDLHFDNHFWREHLPVRYAESRGLSPGQARAELMTRYQRRAGQLEWYCLDFWTRELGLDIRALKAEVAHLIAVRPDVPDFLRRLRDSGLRVVLVTNAHPGSLALKMQVTGLACWFDLQVSSHQVGMPKEAPSFWSALQAIERFDPQRTLFVDDSLPVLDSARAYGIAQLLAIANPDSRQPHKDCGSYQAICSFAQIGPGLTAAGAT
jgi:putative hydrolase of the HAD superfamily